MKPWGSKWIQTSNRTFCKKIIKDYTTLTNNGKRIVLCWISSRVNIPGINQRANTAAKSTLLLPITNMKLPTCELLPHVLRFCSDEWQDIWNNCIRNKLHSIFAVVGTAQHSNTLLLEALIINGLQIGHSRLTHSYIIY